MFNDDEDSPFYYDPDNLNRGDFFLVPGRNWEVETPPQPMTFFSITRGISRIGLLFSIGLFATLFARLIPGAMPGFLLIVAIAITGCIVYVSLSRRTSERILAVMVGAIVLLGIVGGSWDAIYDLLADPSGQKLGFQVSAVAIALLMAVGISLLFRRPS
jgi:hypothetical protein